MNSKIKARTSWTPSHMGLAHERARRSAAKDVNGDHKVAIRLLQAIINEDPDNDAVHNDLAVLHALKLSSTRHSSAHRQLTAACFWHMRKAMSIRPGCAAYMINLAEMYAVTGWNDMALELAKEAVATLEDGLDEPADPHCLQFVPEGLQKHLNERTPVDSNGLISGEDGPGAEQALFFRCGKLLGRLGAPK